MTRNDSTTYAPPLQRLIGCDCTSDCVRVDETKVTKKRALASYFDASFIDHRKRISRDGTTARQHRGSLGAGCCLWDRASSVFDRIGDPIQHRARGIAYSGKPWVSEPSNCRLRGQSRPRDRIRDCGRFLLDLLSNFSLNYIGISDPFLERCLTTTIIVFIGVVGYLTGLGGLEKLEMYAMTIQLAVLSALVVGLLVYNVTAFENQGPVVANESHSVNTTIRMLAGVLLIVQGFETSRFLGEKYEPAVRVQSMRFAQWISGALFIGTVALLMPVVQTMNLIDINLAEIVSALMPVAVVLPTILMVAAVMSQFSAAVADTGGGGGLLAENSANRLSSRFGYVCVCVSSILLVWAVDLLEIIALASRAFAAYYLIQTVVALVANQTSVQEKTPIFWLRQTFFVVIALTLTYIVVFSISVG